MTEPGKGSLPRRLAWWSLLGAVACVATGVELDQQSRRHPERMWLVPEAFRSYAQERLVTQRLASSEDAANTLAEAKRLVARRPIPAESLSGLGIAAINAGDQRLGMAALQEAASRGWRDATAQLVIADVALSSGDDAIAADRIAALWKTRASDDITYQLTRRLLERPRGADLIVSRLLVGGSGVDDFVGWSAQALPSGLLAAVDARLRTGGWAFDCDGIEAARARNLAVSGEIAKATALWRSACDPGFGGKINDLAFDPAGPSGRGPFGWTLLPQAGLEAGIDGRGTQAALSYSNTDGIRKTIATKVVALASGRHGVAVIRDPLVPQRQGQLMLRLTCVQREKGGSSASVEADLGQDHSVIQVPATDCGVQRIDLVTGNGSGKLRRIAID